MFVWGWNILQKNLKERFGQPNTSVFRKSTVSEICNMVLSQEAQQKLVFPAVMYRCESWTIKKAEPRRIDPFWTVMLEKTLESPLDSEEIKPVNPKGNQSWIFIGRTDAEAEAPILGRLMLRSDSLKKTRILGKIEGRRRRGQQRKMVGWHQLNRYQFEQTPGDGEAQGNLECCSPWGHKESYMTERLSWTETFLSDPQNYFSLQ